MAIIFAENSEHGNAPAIWNWDIISGAPAINSTNPMKGTYDIRVGRGDMFADNMQLSAGSGMLKLGTTTVVYTHFWYKLVTAPSAGNQDDVARCGINGSIPAVCALLVNENARLSLSTATYFQLVLGQKVAVELYVGIEGSYPVAKLWVNGTLIDSRNLTEGLGLTTIASIQFGNLSAATGKFNFDAYYDDIVVDTERRIGTGLTLETEVPNADDATEDEWTADDGTAVSCHHVDDTPLVTTDYAKCKLGTADSTSQEQLWAFPATTATGTVLAVDSLFAAITVTALGNLTTCFHRISAPAGTAISTNISTYIATTTRYFRTCRALDCDGNAWTKATADALRVGGQRGANSGGLNARMWFIYDVWKTVVYRDAPQDWAGII